MKSTLTTGRRSATKRSGSNTKNKTSRSPHRTENHGQGLDTTSNRPEAQGSAEKEAAGQRTYHTTTLTKYRQRGQPDEQNLRHTKTKSSRDNDRPPQLRALSSRTKTAENHGWKKRNFDPTHHRRANPTVLKVKNPEDRRNQRKAKLPTAAEERGKASETSPATPPPTKAQAS